jgi:hypothetical protein
MVNQLVGLEYGDFIIFFDCGTENSLRIFIIRLLIDALLWIHKRLFLFCCGGNYSIMSVF